MKKTIFIFIGLFFIGLSVNAGPITFTVTRGLEFPEIVPDLNGGTIERYRGKRNISGIAQFVNNGRDAKILIRGDSNQGVEVEVIGTSVSGAGASMPVHTFQVRGGTTFTLSSSGRYTIRNLGGQLDYAIAQAGGTYTGMIQLRARYVTSFIPTWYYTDIKTSAIISSQSILITEKKELDFAKIAPDSNGGIVEMNSAGNMLNVSGVALFQGNTQRGKFLLKGQANALVFISFNSAPLSQGSNDVKLFDLKANVGTTTTLDSNGRKTILTFGKLDIPANAPPGIYSGTYDIIVNY